ncbi:MAG: ribbon-helix-helix domain-containing protein [Methanosarcina sp.]|jgi:Arc/MetJ-type ribon-helix-helix transcriptional regulator
MAGAQIKKKKVTLNVTISPYLKRKIDALVETEEFSSASDLTTTALTEFLLKHDLEQEEIGAVEILIELLQTEIGRKVINAVLQQKGVSPKIPVVEEARSKIKKIKKEEKEDDEEGEYIGEVIFD